MTRRREPISAEPTAPEPETMAVPQTLGPGDTDPRSTAGGAAIVTSGPLGPGDDDLLVVDRGEACAVRGPLGSGETDPSDAPRNYRMLAQPAAGPGDTYTARRLTVVPVEPARDQS